MWNQSSTQGCVFERFECREPRVDHLTHLHRRGDVAMCDQEVESLMNARITSRGAEAPRRLRKTRIAVALLATAAMCLGPTALAYADEAAPAADPAAPAATNATATDSSSADPAPVADQAPAADPAPAADTQTPQEQAQTPQPAPSPRTATDSDSVATTAPATDPSPDPASETDSGRTADPAPAADPGDGSATHKSRAASRTAAAKPDAGNTDNGHQGIVICHVRAADTNRYGPQPMTVDADSIFKANGHDSHMQDGYTDIIPPFWYVKNGNKHELSQPGTGSFYPGKGWDAAGQAIWNNGCIIPVQPTIVANPGSACLVGDEGAAFSINLVLGSLQTGREYTVTLTKGGNAVWGPQNFTATGDRQTLTATVDSAGTYTATITGPGSSGLTASADLTVQKCPDNTPGHLTPTISLTSAGCLPMDYSSQIGLSIALGNLESGESYTLTITGAGGYNRTESFIASGSTATRSVNVKVSGAYTAKITGPGSPAVQASDMTVVTQCPPDHGEHLTPTIELSGPDCIADTAEASYTITVSLGSLEDGEDYSVTLSGADTSQTQSLTAEGATAMLSMTVHAAGDYEAVVTGPGDTGLSSSAELLVTACGVVVPPCGTDGGNNAEALVFQGVFGEGANDAVQIDRDGNPVFPQSRIAVSAENPNDGCDPAITATVGECTTSGDQGTVAARLEATGLAPETDYQVSVTGPGGFSWTGTITGDANGTGSADVTLGEPGSYTAALGDSASVEFVSEVSCAVKTPPEPPIHHGSKEPPIKPIIHHVTPQPGLPETGASGDTERIAWLALLAILAATALMITPSLRRRHGKR